MSQSIDHLSSANNIQTNQQTSEPTNTTRYKRTARDGNGREECADQLRQAERNQLLRRIEFVFVFVRKLQSFVVDNVLRVTVNGIIDLSTQKVTMLHTDAAAPIASMNPTKPINTPLAANSDA